MTAVLPRPPIQVAVIDAVYPSRLGLESEIAQHHGVSVWPFGSCEEAVGSGVTYDVAVVDPKYLPGISGVAAVRVLAAAFALIVVYTVETGPFALLQNDGIDSAVLVLSKTHCPVALLIKIVASHIDRSTGLHLAPDGQDQFGRRLPTRKQVRVLGLIADGWSNADIARHLGLRAKTIEHHVTEGYHALEDMGEIGRESKGQQRRIEAIRAVRRLREQHRWLAVSDSS